MPASSLIYKSIWQGTINSFPTSGLAGGGVPTPQGGQEGPHVGTHPAPPSAAGVVLSTQMRIYCPPPGAPPAPGDEQPRPPQRDPLRLALPAPPAPRCYTIPKNA